MLTPEPFDPVAERLKALVVERLGLSPKSPEDYLASLRTRGRPAPPPPPPPPIPGNKTLLLELDAIALLLSAPEERFLELVDYVETQVWPPEGSFLGEFLALARKEPRRDHLRRTLSQREEGGRLFERLLLAPRGRIPGSRRSWTTPWPACGKPTSRSGSPRSRRPSPKTPTPPPWSASLRSTRRSGWP